jgi:hypothetical protein
MTTPFTEYARSARNQPLFDTEAPSKFKLPKFDMPQKQLLLTGGAGLTALLVAVIAKPKMLYYEDHDQKKFNWISGPVFIAGCAAAGFGVSKLLFKQ